MKTLGRVLGAALAFTSLVALVGAPAARAQKSPGPTVLISPDETELSVRRDNLRINTETGAAIAVYRAGYEVAPGTPEEMARQYLRENRQLLGLKRPDLSDLRHHATREGVAATTVRLRQHVDGVPVYRGEIAVTIDRHRRVNFVMSSYKPVGDVDIVPQLSAAEARRAALDFLGVEGELHLDTVDLVVYHNRGITRLAHRVRLDPKTAPPGDWEVLRDAHTGEIFRAADLALYDVVDGDGDVFDPDPLSSAGATYGDPGFVDSPDPTIPSRPTVRSSTASG